MIALGDVKISRERFRDATGDMEGLAQSLITYGQLAPIILDDSNELIAGYRRFTAHQMNGGSEIWYVRQSQVDEQLARELELEENVQREDMSPFERVKAIAEIDKLKRAKDPNWTTQKTAASVGSTRPADVSDAVRLAKMAELFPELKDAKSVRQMKSWAESKAANITRVMEVKDRQIDFADIESKIWLGDSVDLIKQVPDEYIDAVITDPPFGLDYGDRKAGTYGSITAYEDSPESYRRLLSMAPDIYRVIKPNGWLIWFMGPSWYEECKLTFRAAGFTVDEIPVIWDRSDGKCHTNRPDRYFARGYDMALHAFKGNPQIIQRGKPNVLRVSPVSNTDREALVERPVELYAELIRRLTVPGERVADFFSGSGSCPAAAASLGRDYFGCELSPERRAIAIKKIFAHTPEGKR